MASWWDSIVEWATGAGWEDWGAAAWQKSPADAAKQADEWIAQTASAGDWSPEWISTASALRQTAYKTAMSGVIIGGADEAIAFWHELAALFALYDSYGPAGWTNLTDTFQSAAGAAESYDDSASSASPGAIVGGTASATADDLERAAPWGAIAAAAAAVALALLVRR